MNTLQRNATPDELLQRASEMIEAGRTRPARSLLAAVQRLDPGSHGLAGLIARLAMGEDRLEDARNCLDAAVAANQNDPGLRLLRAEVLSRMDDDIGAAQDAAEAVILDRNNPVAKALLGVMLLQLGKVDDARSCLAEAVAADPANPAFLQALAAAEDADGAPDAAAATLAAAIAAAPGRGDLRNAAVLQRLRHRDFAGALELAEAARQEGIADACLFGMKGHALSSLGRHAEAGDAYADAAKLGPNDPYVRHLVAASGALPSTGRAPEEYLRTVFDGYAIRFDEHLISLGYRVPGLIRLQVQRHLGSGCVRQLAPVLDLGCGTGLLGVVLSDLRIGPITGIDLSPRMLEQAGAKQLYSELREADLLAFLMEDQRAWPLVLAADVLCYFGDLEQVLRAVSARLTPGGLLIFSVEELLARAEPGLHDAAPPDWFLGRQGRYAHKAGYVERMAGAAGLRVMSLRRETLRYEAGAPVEGILVVLERAGYAA